MTRSSTLSAKLVALVLGAGLIAPALSGCAQGGYYGGGSNNQQTGTVIGAIGGAAAGAAIGGKDNWLWAGALGALAGGVIGNQIGAYLDREDQQRALQNANYALTSVPDGQSARWSNPQNATGGYTTPTRTISQADGQTCREFQTGISAQGQTSTGTGLACRQPDGTWRVVR